MTIETAIKKAVKGGWDRFSHCPQLCDSDDKDDHFFLDPSFWQCLGKEIGLPKEVGALYGLPIIDGWRMLWHRFIDHLAEGKTAESFFEPL